jgi:hypothetical protein
MKSWLSVVFWLKNHQQEFIFMILVGVIGNKVD